MNYIGDQSVSSQLSFPEIPFVPFLILRLSVLVNVHFLGLCNGGRTIITGQSCSAVDLVLRFAPRNL
jgi:hypothetical protein